MTSRRGTAQPSARNIINTYDQMTAAGGDRIAISYQPQGVGREIQVAGWYVWRVVNGKIIATDPKADWYDRGRRFFSLFYNYSSHHVGKKAAFEEAVAWANKTFGRRVFVRNRMGDYVEAEVNERFPIPKRVAP